MTNHDHPETIQPIDDEITRMTWFDIKRSVDRLQSELTRAARRAAIIGRPQPQQAPQLQRSILALICAIGDTIGKINDANTKREDIDTTKPDDTSAKRDIGGERDKPHQPLAPPTVNPIKRWNPS